MAKKYSHDMSQEREKDSFFEKETWYAWKVCAVEDAMSKKDNPQFIITLEENGTLGKLTVYAIAVPKKRWLLKQFLKACDLPASQDGKYDWDIPDVLGKVVYGRVRNEKQDSWIDRNNNMREGEWKSRIAEFKAVETDLGEEPEKP